MKLRKIHKITLSVLALFTIVFFTVFNLYLKSFSDLWYWTPEINEYSGSLYEQGYSLEEIFAMVDEKFCPPGKIPLTEMFGSTSPSTSPPVESSIPVHTHTWRVDTTTDPTCAAEGSIVSVCDDCGKTKTEAVAKTEHEYQLTESDAGSCMEVQKETYTCAVCGDRYTVEGELGEHDYVLQDNSIPAGCETEGLNVYQCSICGESYEETLAPLGHEYPKTKDVIAEATCTGPGLKAYRCIRCSLHSEEEEIPPTGHSTQYSVTEAPTLFHNGRAVDLCSNCMSSVTEYTLPAKIPVWARVAASVAVILLTGGIILIVRKVSRKKAAVA